MTTISSEHHGFDLLKYHINYETGFMLPEPLKRLPKYFEPWNELATKLPDLFRRKKFREAVNKLRVLDDNKLVGHRQLRLAHLQLSLITAGYVWQEGDKGLISVLPKCLAIPYCKISEKLGAKPITSYIDMVLANWELIDPLGPYMFRNLKCLYHLPEERSGDWFCIVPFMMEFSFVKCLKSVVRILDLLGSTKYHIAGGYLHESEAETEMVQCLWEVCKATEAMENSLSKLRERLDAKTFFNVIRPFLDGWGGDSSPLPDGLVYEGYSDDPLKLTGGSGAQSVTLQVLDSLLGVQHRPDKREFLHRMRTYMLPSHRRFVEDIELYPHKLRDFVMSSNNHKLMTSYNQCLSALTKLRDYHIQIVKMYVLIPSRNLNEGNATHLNERGTGGSNLIPFLQDIQSATQDKLLLTNHKNISVANENKTLAVTIGFFIMATIVVAFGIALKSFIAI